MLICWSAQKWQKFLGQQRHVKMLSAQIAFLRRIAFSTSLSAEFLRRTWWLAVCLFCRQVDTKALFISAAITWANTVIEQDAMHRTVTTLARRQLYLSSIWDVQSEGYCSWFCFLHVITIQWLKKKTNKQYWLSNDKRTSLTHDSLTSVAHGLSNSLMPAG